METTESSNALLTPGLMALLHDTVDYAGLFPPADLPLDTAMHNYAQYRSEPEAWMLSRFVLPVRRLPDLASYRGLFKAGEPYHFSVLGTGGPDGDSFLTALESDLSTIDAFDEAHGGRALADVMEVRLPDALVGSSHDALLNFLEEVHRTIVAAGTAKLDVFFEAPTSKESLDALPALAAAVTEHNSRQTLPTRCEIGLKIRCGGMDPSDVPSSTSVARFIHACVEGGVRFKATAGLHHPTYHYDDSLETMKHGFFNVFGASVLAAEHRLNADSIRTILEDENAESFQFTKDGFGWRDLPVDLDGIDHARENVILSFGSCSFEDPIHDLNDLNLM